MGMNDRDHTARSTRDRKLEGWVLAAAAVAVARRAARCTCERTGERTTPRVLTVADQRFRRPAPAPSGDLQLAVP